MKIYVSAGFTSQKRLQPLAAALWAKGHQVTSTWLHETKRPDSMPGAAFNKKLGIKDLAEIQACDLLISDRFEPSTSGGLYVEMGVALGRFQHCQVWIVGPCNPNPFDALADQWFDTWDAMLEAL